MAELTIQEVFQMAVQYHRAGQLAQAETFYKQILTRQPDHAEALHLLGVIARQVGRPDVAVELIGQAITLKPDYSEAYYNLGNALQDQGQVDEAIAAFGRAVALDPCMAEAHNNLGNALRDMGQLDAAITECRQAVVLKPGLPEAHNNLGNALKDKGQLDEAIAAFRQAIALKFNYPEAHSNLGVGLSAKGQLDDAVTAFRQAIALAPNYSKAYSNLGIGLKDKGQLDEALAACRQAIALNPRNPEAYSNLGNVLKYRGQLDEAVAAYRQALAFKPDSAEVRSNLADGLRAGGQLDEAIAADRQAIALKLDLPEAHSNLVFSLHYHPGYSAQAIGAEHRRWSRQHAAPLQKFIAPHANPGGPGQAERRLRIGYVSPDLREHPVGRFLLPLLANHDPRCVEVFAYAQVPVPDKMTERLRSHTDAWRSIVGLPDAQVADLVRQDQIDVLVDLAMHTANNRLLVFARKPAPVQVTYLACCSSTGLDTIDYRLSDPYLDPPGMDESIYSEQTIRLPETYWCYQPSIATPAVGPTPAAQPGLITFGCLNNFCKVSAPTLAAWAQLLRAMPDSQLLLHAHEGSHRQRVRETLERDGIAPTRVRFAEKVSPEKYFELYRQIDIALDTFPYGGGTTTCDALWMGAPVVSLVGQTAVGRAGLSILSNVGLPELVARSPEEYVQIACELGNDLPRLRIVRSTLRQRMQASPLMDAPRFARNVESAYRQMWRKWCAAGAKESNTPKGIVL